MNRKHPVGERSPKHASTSMLDCKDVLLGSNSGVGLYETAGVVHRVHLFCGIRPHRSVLASASRYSLW